ncbi:DUF2484 family protein [Sinisalibacter lacisalsi]|uniref:UDP-N-acetylmuramate--alanine ligase n=1 Tax=Sinisalibacter lacisalsi TaxID=1526570 RepID=A0ABQ1QRP3_9RHOB|nr:DUF2484 family protein [Sinisalibacter lacisalsi]GGD42626.1 hypothetical protein GCM10011358_28070 [Sinisalibacter lacisalsi]
MTPSLVFAALWVIAATAVAFLPIRRQIIPGAALGLAGLALIVWIGVDHGWLWALPAFLAFASLFRNGFKAIPALIRGEKLEIPDE